MTQTSRTRTLVYLLDITIAVIIFLIPFHAILTVWLSTVIGHYTAIRLWKEYLLIILSIAALGVAYSNKKIRRALNHSWLYWLTLSYVLLTLFLGIVAIARHQVDRTALGYALIINLRLFIFFWVCVVVASRSTRLKRNWQRLLLIPGAIVVLFGLFQHFVLPADFLRHLGYGPHTIAPFETVDQNNQYVRVQSTLRGPNPLGAYLVVIITALFALFFQAKGYLKRWLVFIYALSSAIILFFSYSRSAWIGVVLSVALGLWIGLGGRSLRRITGIVLIILVVAGAVGYSTLRHNVGFENTFFHTSTLTPTVIGSNQKHESALISGIKDIIHQPFGRGPGTAGPASVYNNHPARIAENYYVQLGQEIGVPGMVLFIVINVLIAKALWDNRRDQLSLILFCSLLGISFINFLSHAWADDTLAYVWWGLAGIALAPVILKAKENVTHETQRIQKKATV